MNSTTRDIVCMGEPMYEFTRKSVAGEGEVYVPGFGGDTSNCAIAAARQGASVGYVTALGCDRFGDALMDLWKREAVDTSAIYRDPTAPTGIYFIDPSPEGRDFTYYRAGSAASRLRADQVPVDEIAAAKIFHVSAISQAIGEVARGGVSRAIEVARAGGAKVSYDTNLRLNLWELDVARSITRKAVALCDIALPSLDDSKSLTGLDDPEDILDFYLGLGPEIVALKLGVEGVLVATSEMRAHVSGHQVASVDATGAGDCFDGAFLARLVAGDEPLAAATYANAAAALTTTGLGAVAPIPSAEAVLNLLRETEC